MSKPVRNTDTPNQDLAAQLRQRIPPEPPADEADAVTIQFRLPNNSKAGRRFTATDCIQHVINYVGSLGFTSEKYILVRSVR